MRPEILNPLFADVTTLPGIGPKLEKTLTKLLIGAEANSTAQIRDLLFHLPAGIIDRRYQPGIANAREGELVTLKIHVDDHRIPPKGNKSIPWRVDVHDETGALTLVFFRAHGDYVARMLPIGQTRYVSGKIEYFHGMPNMAHPDLIADEQSFKTMPLVEPVYPGTAGLARKTQQKAVASALERLPKLPEWLDADLLSRQGWPSFDDAIKRLHSPRDLTDLGPQAPYRKRLACDEFLAGQLALALTRKRMKTGAGTPWRFGGKITQKILTAFGHELTKSQKNVVDEINHDLRQPERMIRLLQGDVGSGKTIVALCAMANIVEAGAQAAIMVPTEILARQHLATIAPLCQAADINAAILTGREKGSAREKILAGIASGQTQIVIGTHALFQQSVEFNHLGLAIVDEQHRFGVHQRLLLTEKGQAADLLVMTATPIPRTLVMTYYGDMDVSQLTDKPAGRREIATSAMPVEKLPQLIERLKAALEKGEKAYWICPLVEESEALDLVSAETRFDALKKRFAGQVGLVHGRMKAAEKDAVMEDFRSGKTRILVATTVVEVGVDVPDATIIIIEHAERFGLAQLHQLRGRVGRSDRASNCILFYKAPLGQNGRARINIMRQTNDGFKIAEEDLRLRGKGEVLGTRQSGMAGFNLADPEHHSPILQIARDQARLIIEENEKLEGERGKALRYLLYLFGKDRAIRLIRSG